MRHSARTSLRVVAAGCTAVLGVAAMVAVAAAPNVAQAESMEYSIARGGLLYDKWFKVVEAETPTTAHPAYPKDGEYYGKKGADWRCKECHGWDYQGKDGAYSEGKHYSGIKGIRGMAGADPDAIVAVLKDGTHGYTDDMMSAADFQDLALFVSKGQMDMDPYIDRATKKSSGDAARGQGYYETVCANCHGLDGKKVKDMKPIGQLMSNPWEILHKVLNGQPGENMPALRALDIQVAVDILAHLETLPKE